MLYGGNELFDYEIDSTFWNDMRLSLVTLILIVIFMLVRVCVCVCVCKHVCELPQCKKDRDEYFHPHVLKKISLDKEPCVTGHVCTHVHVDVPV